ncbi:hypothetical protein PTSG_03464 [Salpingoeca rosetta]|uniref:ubiquitinyl hydrolase 1 n=1 Tax=Salpingoeca rosetta (strain ATCC 50818 / BSB-021) TaxID=946362 RepID=F2U598_SALR5|nr:uncharacterized protein PTSG_03464 [Salpingoeca rosetta]EGD82814.1 hypothetical protein PTSG_03464 [Salpingoeca rosetta]|eukprot:XP_004996049.1 hypothetical protein PTSG_03464 [Salpingoeca rosetta]
MTHVPRVCIRSPGDHTAPNTCLACLLSDFFSEMYTGNRQQLAPTNMLYAVWKHLRQLAGYAQHDCHEFFIALLDRLHRHLRPPDEPMHLLSKQPSVVRSVFTGLMQSDVICRRCDNVSSTHEPFYDISLGIRPSTHDSPTSLVSLRGCLARYTSPEDLGSDARVFCPRCQARQLAQKRLMIAQPPKTLTFHLKRFEHIPRLQKITTFVEFPTSIDMRPYLVQSGGGAHTAAMAHSAHAPIMYSLYCVVVHIGKIESGHYICYIRLNHPHEQWVCCDDDTLTPVTAAEVLSKPAYMLLYMKDEL